MQFATSFVSQSAFIAQSASRVSDVRRHLLTRFMGSDSPASVREFQLVIFGASGYTGEYVVENLIRYISKNNASFSWAAAGRDATKVSSVLRAVGTRTGINLDKINVIKADVADVESLNGMAKRTMVLVNCTGPYRMYGEPIVKACVGQATHYLDIAGEPEFMEAMQLKYHKVAEEKKIYVISACGFDSVPCDMGVNFVRDNFEGKLVSIESFLALNDGSRQMTANSTTWDSAVEGMAHKENLKDIRKDLFREVFANVPVDCSKGLERKRLFSYTDDRISGWGFPFPGSDRSVVRRSQMSNYQNYNEKPVLVETYSIMSLPQTILIFIVAFFLEVLGPFAWGRSLLKRYPELFSLGIFKINGPTKDEVDSGNFAMTFVGRGCDEDDKSECPKKEIVVRLEGPHPGYPATAICLTQSIMTLLEEDHRMPGQGGVLSPGAAFRRTSLMQRLLQNGLRLDIVRK